MGLHMRGGNLKTLQVAQAQLPVFLRDETYLQVVEETWITIVMNSYSTRIAGYTLSDVPGELPLLLALEFAYSPEKRAKKLSDLSISDLSWDVDEPSPRIVEVPLKLQNVIVKRYAAKYGISIQNRAQGGGSSSRFFATLKSQVLWSIPGVYEINGKPRQRQRAIKNSVLTIEKMDKIIMRYILSCFNPSQEVWDFSKINLEMSNEPS